MKEWKKKIESKKKDIQMIERKRWSDNKEYQGEAKDGIRQGFGI